MDETIVTVSVENALTVTAMVLIVFGAIGLAMKLFHSMRGHDNA
jgi:hypothetical protein